MTGQRIGYVRVSTVEQNSDRQLDGLDLDRVFTDHMSGDATNRPALADCIAYCREGDTVFVHSLDRLGRNLVQLRSIVEELTGKGALVEFVKERLLFSRDETNPFSTLMMNVLGAFAEHELSMIRARQREGIQKAKARGVYTGRKPAFTPDQAQVVRERARAGESKVVLAREYGVSRKTIYEYLRAS